MSDNQGDSDIYANIFDEYKDYNVAYKSIYKIDAQSDDEIEKIFQGIKTTLIEKYKVHPANILNDISYASKSHYKLIKPYWSLFKKIYNEYKPDISLCQFNNLIRFLLFKEYEIKKVNEDEESNIKDFDLLSVHEQNSILTYIMNDDIDKITEISKQKNFNVNQRPDSILEMENWNLLEWCSYYGSVKCFNHFVSNFDFKISQKCLEVAFLSCNTDIIKQCLDVVQPNEKCVLHAIISHQNNILQNLLEKYEISFDINHFVMYKNMQGFFIYCHKQNNINECLVYSAGFCIPSLTEKLIQKGGKINYSVNGISIIHIASMYNNHEILESVISKGAEVEIKDKDGRTPLHYAAEFNSTECVKILIDNKCDVNCVDVDDLTPLHLAALRNCAGSAQLLLEKGAKVNAVNKYQNTPLHFAAKHNRVEVTKILLKNGADPKLKAQDGLTPAQYAELNGHFETYQVISETKTCRIA